MNAKVVDLHRLVLPVRYNGVYIYQVDYFMYRSSLFLAAALVGTNMALVQPIAAAKSASEVKVIAKAVTVEIKIKSRDNGGKIVEEVGSGTIIDRVASSEGNRKGNLYTLVTNKHVVCGGQPCSKLPPVESYNLGLADGQQYRVKASSIKLLGDDLDLAIIQFRSDRNYAIAKVASSGGLKADDDVYTAGFPFELPGFTFGEGKAISVVNKRITGDKGGYTIIYDSTTFPGMSGGGVFNSNGQLVAIHGQGDRFKENTNLEDNSKVGSKTGANRGIPVRWLVQNLAEVGINLGTARSLSDIRAARPQLPKTADEYFIAGLNQWIEPGDNVVSGKKQAIQDFSTAIRLNPRYEYAYFMRAYVYAQVKEFQQSLADYNQAISINPKDSLAYFNRAILKANKLNDIQGGLNDYNQVILINPEYFQAYSNRASLKDEKLADLQGALADYNRAILINPEFADAYNNRAILKYEKLNDIQGALADYNQAIIMNSKNSGAYYNRANLKEDVNDIQGALADYNQAIIINSKNSGAYNNRGLLKYFKLKDRAGGIQDLRQAVRLFREEGNNRNLQLTIRVLQELGVNE
jgi:tetratricopeptide (TPR) repeat protein/S1-C subfamily serine protease